MVRDAPLTRSGQPCLDGEAPRLAAGERAVGAGRRFQAASVSGGRQGEAGRVETADGQSLGRQVGLAARQVEQVVQAGRKRQFPDGQPGHGQVAGRHSGGQSLIGSAWAFRRGRDLERSAQGQAQKTAESGQVGGCPGEIAGKGLVPQVQGQAAVELGFRGA